MREGIGAAQRISILGARILHFVTYSMPLKISTREVGATGMPALHHESEDRDVIGKIKEALIQRIGVQRFDLWFGHGVTFREEAETVLVEVTGEFALERLRKNYFRHLESAVAEVKGGLSPVRMRASNQPDLLNGQTNVTAGLNNGSQLTNNNQSVSTSPSSQPKQPGSPVQSSRTPLRNPVSFRRQPDLSRGPAHLVAFRSAAIDSEPSAPHTGHSLEGQHATASMPPSDDASTISASETASSRSEAMTFANFASGNSNQLAHTAAKMLAAQPGDAAPICFWGATGTGKTHLLHAIRHELRHRHRMQRVILLSAEDFTNDFLTAVRGAGLPAFRKRYRDVDALLIDNIQFFGGKSATLREVLYTVDTIISRKRPLVLAGDRPPMEIEGLSGELAGRLSSGLVCGLNPHELNVRCELLRRESMRSFITWDEETIQALAMRISGDGRLIQGIGRLVSTLQRMYRRMPTLAEILREAGDMLQRGPRSVALADIERAVCAAFNLPAGELRSEAKTRNVSQPRILAMYLARQHTNAAYSEIGRYFGDRNHSTVIAAYRRAEGWLKNNQSVGGRGTHGLKVQEAIDTVENLLRIG
jgi:chromosomal replication initiator protein